MSAWPQIPKVSFQLNASSLAGGLKALKAGWQWGSTEVPHVQELSKAPGTEDVPISESWVLLSWTSPTDDS